MISRRMMLAGGVAATSGTGFAAHAQDAAHSGQLMAIRGTHLYVEDHGPKTAPALLYLHGGPGAGSYDFSVYQGERMPRLRLIIMDQRGVLRSDPVTDMVMDDLVLDCEAVREALGIRRWAVLGHSFGGHIALRYAAGYPQSLKAVAFENPSLDLAGSVRELMRASAAIFTRDGEADNAALALGLANDPHTPQELWSAFGDISGKLGPERRETLYTHKPELQNFFGKLMDASTLSDDEKGRSGGQVAAIQKEGKLFDDLRPLLKQVATPALMLKGKYDHVTPPEQLDAFAAGPKRTTRVFDDSAHFVHVEQADDFAATASDFVLANA